MGNCCRFLFEWILFLHGGQPTSARSRGSTGDLIREVDTMSAGLDRARWRHRRAERSTGMVRIGGTLEFSPLGDSWTLTGPITASGNRKLPYAS
jgi:hypothetical protein